VSAKRLGIKKFVGETSVGETSVLPSFQTARSKHPPAALMML